MSLWSEISPSTPLSLSLFFSVSTVAFAFFTEPGDASHTQDGMWMWVLQPQCQGPGDCVAIVPAGPHWVHVRAHTPGHTIWTNTGTHRNKAHNSLLQDTIFLALLRQPWPNLHLTTPSAQPDFYSTFWHAEDEKTHLLLVYLYNRWLTSGQHQLFMLTPFAKI